MLQSYLRQAYRDRRRLLLALALNLAAGHFGYGSIPNPLAVVSTGTLVVAGFLILVPILTFRFRAMRHWVEIIALGNFIVTLHGHVFPQGFFVWHDAPFLLTLQIPAFLGLLAGLRFLLYGRWSDALTLRRRMVAKAKLRTRLPLHDLWYGMVPTPGFADRNPDREVVSIQFADTTRKVVRLVTWIPPRAGTGEVLVHFDEVVPLEYARFRLRTVDGIHDPDAEGETEFFFEDRGSERVLRLRHKVNGFTPRRILMNFLDDTFGRIMSARLAAIEARARSGRPTKTAVRYNAWFDGGNELAEIGPESGDHRTAYGRPHSDDEARALAALGRA